MSNKLNILPDHKWNDQFVINCVDENTTQSMLKQILVLKPKNFLTFICLPASLIDFYYVGENKSFGDIAGTEEALKLGNKYFL